ncbi:hypothetical protein M569_02216, partial [Genlisea aurea]
MPWPDFRSVFRSINSTISFVSENRNSFERTGDSPSHVQSPLIGFEVLQSDMQETQLGRHTLRSHGIKLARKHKHDWLILLLLGIFLHILSLISPYHRFVGKDMISDLKYPMKTNTVPFWFVTAFSVLFPTAVSLLFYLRQRNVYDLHHSILGLLFSVLVTEAITDVIKVAVGRPRPDFFWRCFPDGKDAYDQWGNVVCHGDPEIIKQGHKSFPSGHTAFAFAGLGFLSLYLSAKIRLFDRRGHISKLCVPLLPLLAASLIGISRLCNYKHHWQDVLTGGFLGFVVATLSYLQFFPPPYHPQGFMTHEYLHLTDQ